MSIQSTSGGHDPGLPGKRIAASPSGKLAYTIPQAVQTSGLSRSALYIAIRSGDLRAIKAGRRTLILDDDLRAFLCRLPALESVK